MVPVPAPNDTAAVLSVPGAADGSPGPEPMFRFPIEPGDAATIIASAADPITPPEVLTVPPSAIVSVPVPPNMPTVRNPLLDQVEPAPVTVTVPCEPGP